MPGVSLNPDKHAEGGAIPTGLVEWAKVYAGTFDYAGKANPAPGVFVLYKREDGSTAEQFYSAGNAERITPTDDGEYLEPVVEGASITKSSNFHILLDALVKGCGYPANKLDEGNGAAPLSRFNGMITINEARKAPERPGLPGREIPEGTVAREKQLSLPVKIVKMPWEKKGAVAAKAPAKAAAKGMSDEAKELLSEVVGKLIEASDEGKVNRAAIAGKFFSDKKLSANPNRDSIIREIYTPIGAKALEEAGFTLDGEEISKS